MILGHQENIDKLNEQISKNEIIHSYIFCGPNGIGKKLVAVDFAKRIMCKNETEEEEFEKNNMPDYIYIAPDDKGSIKIETIRTMIADISIKPMKSEYKVYIIDDSDRITEQAQNALLKTLEEPPLYVVIILVTSKYNSIIETIRSRCKVVEFEKLSNENIQKYIKENSISIDLEENILLSLINGSIAEIYDIQKNILIIQEMIKIFFDLKQSNLFEYMKLTKLFVSNKVDIEKVLKWLEIIIYNRNDTELKKAKGVKCVEEARKSLAYNVNLEICIDKMLQNMWEEYNG